MSNSVAEIVAQWVADVKPDELPISIRASARRSFLDIVGFSLAVRNVDHVKAAISAWGENDDCSVIGQGFTMEATGAAFVNDTAARGFFYAFGVNTIEPVYTKIIDGLGDKWLMSNVVFKQYACGTMCQPFIDVARKLAVAGVELASIGDIKCNVGEGTVHRLWEPKKEKINPTTSYSAKFSAPYCIAVAPHKKAAGLDRFIFERIRDAKVIELAGTVNYRIDPENEYPANYSGHIRVVMNDGSVHEIKQPQLRGGTRQSMIDEELSEMLRINAGYGGWQSENFIQFEAF